jgi:hypothetical protein
MVSETAFEEVQTKTVCYNADRKLLTLLLFHLTTILVQT